MEIIKPRRLEVLVKTSKGKQIMLIGSKVFSGAPFTIETITLGPLTGVYLYDEENYTSNPNSSRYVYLVNYSNVPKTYAQSELNVYYNMDRVCKQVSTIEVVSMGGSFGYSKRSKELEHFSFSKLNPTNSKKSSNFRSCSNNIYYLLLSMLVIFFIFKYLKNDEYLKT